ncbi:MAG: hypothetical protein CMI63_17070 [Parvularcula sp.]|nr:hypothetical protein [Parvularcula sp.]
MKMRDRFIRLEKLRHSGRSLQMLNMKRRDVLASGIATVASITAARAGTLPGNHITIVFSPKVPQARILAQRAAPLNEAIPLNGELVTLWKNRLRNHGGPLKGYTNWSDYVLLRGLAEEQGLRVREEIKLNASGKTLFRWTIA